MNRSSTAVSQMRACRVYETEPNSDTNVSRIKKSVLSLAAILLICLIPTSVQACTNPVGVAGDMVYNDTDEVMQWCDGTNWNAAGTSPYIPNAVTFDNGDDLGTISGPTNTKTVTGSFWFNSVDPPGSSAFIQSYNSVEYGLRIGLDSVTRQIEIIGENTSRTQILEHFSTAALNDGQWHHVVFSYDLSNPANAHLYIDDVAQPAPSIYTDDFMDTDGSFAIGRPGGSPNNYDGDLADFWLDFGTYMDLSDVTIRRQFIDAQGFPVDLGSDGSKPTGSSPFVFLSGDTATWHTNDGTGGGLTENGTLTDALSSPGENLGPTAGLVGWWKLDETSGTTAVDSSVNGNNGTMNGGLDASNDSVDGPIDNALDFDGSDDYVVIADDAAFDTITNEITMSIWLNKQAENSFFVCFFCRPLGSGFLDLWSLFYNPGGNYTFWHNLLGAHANFDSGFDSDVDIGTWTHIALTYDGTTLRMYRNSAEIANQVVAAGSFANVGTDVIIGADYDFGTTSYTQYSTALIDDARVYNRALSPTEITSLYDAGVACKNPDGFRGGDVMYNTTHHIPQYCNLRQWKAMGATAGDGGAGCSNPTGVAGDFSYNTTSNVMTYCEGDDWKPVGVYN